MDITAVAIGSVPRFSATAARYFALLRVYFALLCKKQQRNYHTASQQSSPHSCESKTCYLPLLGLLHGRVLTGNCTLVLQ